MKKIFVILFSACLSMGATAQSTLTFNANAGVKSKMTVYTGRAPKAILDLDMQRYLNYVVSTQALKGVPAFASQIEGINSASGENEEFGDETGKGVNFLLAWNRPHSGDYALDELFQWIASIVADNDL